MRAFVLCFALLCSPSSSVSSICGIGFPCCFSFLHQKKKKEMARTRLQKIWNSLLPSHAFIVTISSVNCLVSNALDPGITTNEREEDMLASSSSSSVKKCTSPYSTNIIVSFNNNNSSNMEMVLLVLFFCRKSLLVYPPLVSSIA